MITVAQIVSYFIALVIFVAATAATAQSATWGTWAILPLNAVIVSLSANGAFAAVSRAVSGTVDRELRRIRGGP